MRPRSPDTLYLVAVSVDPGSEGEFNRFYQRDHIPAVLDAAPELVSARRYAQFGVDGSLRWYERQYLAIYECDAAADLDRLAASGPLASEHPAAETWQRWTSGPVRVVDRAVYRQVYEHPRRSWDGPFGSRPFFLVTADIAGAHEEAFARWYHEEYLPTNVAEVPGWVAVRRYASWRREPRRTFVVYEAESEEGMARALAAMRAGNRVEDNLAWHRWDPIFTFQDAATYRPIYRAPA